MVGLIQRTAIVPGLGQYHARSMAVLNHFTENWEGSAEREALHAAYHEDYEENKCWRAKKDGGDKKMGKQKISKRGVLFSGRSVPTTCCCCGRSAELSFLENGDRPTAAHFPPTTQVHEVLQLLLLRIAGLAVADDVGGDGVHVISATVPLTQAVRTETDEWRELHTPRLTRPALAN